MSARRAPYWPAYMRRELAALYVDLPAADFERAVAGGELPQPEIIVGKERWNRDAIDIHRGRLTGDVVPDWRQQQPGLRDAA